MKVQAGFVTVRIVTAPCDAGSSRTVWFERTRQGQRGRVRWTWDTWFAGDAVAEEAGHTPGA